MQTWGDVTMEPPGGSIQKGTEVGLGVLVSFLTRSRTGKSVQRRGSSHPLGWGS